ncbi:NAD-dependent epimerase/dehydratase family protein [Candidatus Woesearchaeota archaeon]|nr:NAD-dependent epimerase/dehydratase family protein [Candidatus Woesearchaeota archaeon]
MPKKILVTGGCGFIASNIVDMLIEKGNEVIIIDNLSTGKQEYLNPKAKLYKEDIRNTEEIDNIFKKEQPEVVIHAAAQVMLRKSLEQPAEDASINIIGTISVLEACKNNKVKKIIYTSTGGARVGEPEYLPVDEKHPIKPTSPYGISKHTAEHYVWLYNYLYDLDYLIFCFGNVYGPRDDPKTKRVTAIFSHLMLNNETPKIFGDGEQTRDFLYVKDLAGFIVNSIDKNPKHKLFHLANGKQISVNEIFSILKNLSGFKGNAEHVDAIKGEVKDIVLDTTLAKEELGWEPKHSFEEGLKETFEWFEKQSFSSHRKS